MSDDESSQEASPDHDAEIAGAAAGGGDVDMVSEKSTGGRRLQQLQMQQMLAAAARKRAKLCKKAGSGGSSKSSSSRTRPVVKLLVTSVSRSYSEPWRRRQQRESSGTGFLLRWRDVAPPSADCGKDGDEAAPPGVDSIRIVTNAHVVRNASTVRARASFGPHVVSCDVEWLSLPLDLALLKITHADWGDFCKGWNIGDLSSDGSGTAASFDGEASAGAVRGGDGGETSAAIGADASPSNAAAATGESGKSAGGVGGGEAGNNEGAERKDSNSICLTLSSGLPKLDENVTCVGFPQGGTQISVTRGVVSRIDVDAHYVLRIQIDAAINPGNSGGPVFDEQGHVVGIASSHLRGAGNIGYIIPSKIVAMFLQMCMDGMEVKVEDRFSGLGELVVRTANDENESKHVPGIPNLAIHGSQSLESKALRRHLGLEELDLNGGVRIVGAIGSTLGSDASKMDDAPHPVEGDADKDSEGANEQFPVDGAKESPGRLKADDVLLGINGIPIGMDGTIQLSPTRPDERINFRSLVTCQRVGSKVTLDVLRNKQRRELEVGLDMSKFLVSQYDDFDAVPLYVVVGGCVFSPLTLPLVQEKSSKSKSPSTFTRYYRDQRQGNEQVLVLSKVLNDEVNVGYHGWKNLVLKSVNGYEPTNIQELVGILARKMHSEMIEFRCQLVGQEDDADYVICMTLKDVLSSEHRILKQHMIASWCSTDALSKELREEIEKCEPDEAKRTVCWNTMKDMRTVLEREGGE